MQTKFSSGAEAAPEAHRDVPALPHHLIVENQNALTATGVTRIVSYDENGASLELGRTGLVIGGAALQVSELSIQTGEVHIQGRIEYIQYTRPKEPVSGLFRRLAR